MNAERQTLLGLEQLSPQDRNIVSHARQLDRFLTQPFFTTEHFRIDFTQPTLIAGILSISR
jgi:F0F1-type ATP synthase beta subunit